jgi:sulfide:quinone oxidoreductase
VQVGIDVHVVAPTRDFFYRPLAVAAPFGLGDAYRFDLGVIASHQGAQLHLDSLSRVDGESNMIHLASGIALPYDALLVAVGAKQRDWLPGALHFGGFDDVTPYRALLERLERGEVDRVCFANPPGLAWTLPLYELALLTASYLAERGVIGTELVIATPEKTPLAVFGRSASRILREVLADRGIALRPELQALELANGVLRLSDGGELATDEVVTLSQLEGPRIRGLQTDDDGFIRIDTHSRVMGSTDVYAAGDGTDYPIKQGGIAAQQADAAVEAILAGLGGPTNAKRVRPTLRGMLLTGIAPFYLRSAIADGANPVQATIDPLWWPPSKIAARYLAPYLAGRNALAREHELSDRPVPRHQTDSRAADSHEEARAIAVAFAERDASDGDFDSALEWLEVLERLDGVLAPEYVERRDEWQARGAA